MTKLSAALFLFTAIIFNSFAQHFEGSIVYQTTFKSKLPDITDEQFNTMMGNTMTYLIKEGDYKSITNGTFLQWQIYLNKDNKVYTKVATFVTILWNDGAENKDEVIKAEINKGVITILGYTCDELILTCKTSVQKYYFNSSLKINAKLYEQHKYGNWSEVASRAGALPLKIIQDNPQYSLEAVATEVKPMKLEGNLFELPADSKIEKSPY